MGGKKTEYIVFSPIWSWDVVGICKQIQVSDRNLEVPVKVLVENSLAVSSLHRLRKEVGRSGAMEDFSTPEDVKLVV